MKGVIISILGFILFIILIVLNRIGLLNVWILVGIGGFAMLGIIFFLMFKLVDYRNKSLNDYNDRSKKSIKSVLTRVNQELADSPGGDVITWKGGIGNFYKTQYIKDTNNKPHEIKAIFAEYKSTAAQIVIYYDSTDDKILSVIGEPDAQTLVDPFKTFDLVKRDPMGFNPGMNKYSKNKKRGGIRIIQDDEDDVNDYANKIQNSPAFEDLDE